MPPRPRRRGKPQLAVLRSFQLNDINEWDEDNDEFFDAQSQVGSDYSFFSTGVNAVVYGGGVYSAPPSVAPAPHQLEERAAPGTPRAQGSPVAMGTPYVRRVAELDDPSLWQQQSEPLSATIMPVEPPGLESTAANAEAPQSPVQPRAAHALAVPMASTTAARITDDIEAGMDNAQQPQQQQQQDASAVAALVAAVFQTVVTNAASGGPAPVDDDATPDVPARGFKLNLAGSTITPKAMQAKGALFAKGQSAKGSRSSSPVAGSPAVVDMLVRRNTDAIAASAAAQPVVVHMAAMQTPTRGQLEIQPAGSPKELSPRDTESVDAALQMQVASLGTPGRQAEATTPCIPSSHLAFMLQETVSQVTNLMSPEVLSADAPTSPTPAPSAPVAPMAPLDGAEPTMAATAGSRSLPPLRTTGSSAGAELMEGVPMPEACESPCMAPEDSAENEGFGGDAEQPGVGASLVASELGVEAAPGGAAADHQVAEAAVPADAEAAEAEAQTEPEQEAQPSTQHTGAAFVPPVAAEHAPVAEHPPTQLSASPAKRAYKTLANMVNKLVPGFRANLSMSASSTGGVAAALQAAASPRQQQPPAVASAVEAPAPQVATATPRTIINDVVEELVTEVERTSAGGRAAAQEPAAAPTAPASCEIEAAAPTPKAASGAPGAEFTEPPAAVTGEEQPNATKNASEGGISADGQVQVNVHVAASGDPAAPSSEAAMRKRKAEAEVCPEDEGRWAPYAPAVKRELAAELASAASASLPPASQAPTPSLPPLLKPGSPQQTGAAQHKGAPAATVPPSMPGAAVGPLAAGAAKAKAGGQPVSMIGPHSTKPKGGAFMCCFRPSAM